MQNGHRIILYLYLANQRRQIKFTDPPRTRRSLLNKPKLTCRGIDEHVSKPGDLPATCRSLHYIKTINKSSSFEHNDLTSYDRIVSRYSPNISMHSDPLVASNTSAPIGDGVNQIAKMQRSCRFLFAAGPPLAACAPIFPLGDVLLARLNGAYIVSVFSLHRYSACMKPVFSVPEQQQLVQ